ncbi:TonB-dependent receptor [Mucilaginibacter sp. Bleaf8]|uniref:TonB-dependent receptor plug domain-containing protein n=1 Tax=Mucilaginibacter sp. Bleaf8 TaxID=2834430 RepID=UPI001BCC2FD0|nr:TonB-dependent receptor [Mucilaginibacter sp. Bleaf8]MBS7564108.1 TonB-dependent receptor [Mucilaginibacter sp. Bleaf8]
MLASVSAVAQRADSLKRDTSKAHSLKDVVVTATRSGKELMQLPMPVTTISNQEIKNRGMVRLNEVLNEQTGLVVLPDAHGQGLQIQGFGADYTMIMLDGLPLIGRTTGILELSRITTNNIDRIEVVKGPVSSLYGSEAMAGVVNIITATPPPGSSVNFLSRYGTNNTADLSLNAGYSNTKLAIAGFVNRYSSSGYSLQPQSGSATVFPFYGYTLNGKATYKLGANTDIRFLIRNYTNTQRNNYLVEGQQVTGNGQERDFNLSPSIAHRFSDRFSSELKLYHSSYKTNALLNYTANNTVYDDTYFNQQFNRAEWQQDFQWTKALRLISGVGGQYESVEATRYDQKQSFTSGYLYAQTDWQPLQRLNVIAGARYDIHSVYRSQLSPKLAVSYKLSDKLVLMGSTGKGYKAPDFRQLYLNFTNSVVGYSVFGYQDAYVQLQKLQQEGQIQSILIDPASLQALNAESSTAYNLGWRYRPWKPLLWTVNFFRNNIRDLIDSQPIAIKNNGQSVYSYFNLHQVYTQGVETDVNYSFLKHWNVTGGFQFLQAYDQSVLDHISEGQVFGVNAANREVIKVTKAMYGGLLNRSRYMANIRLGYQESKSGIIASLRAIYRGRYGFSDIDGNGIVNRDDEYVKGYVLFNASVSKLIYHNRLRLQLTAENLGNYKAPLTISNLPGRLWYAGLSYSINQP